jgi:hypothetical protein
MGCLLHRVSVPSRKVIPTQSWHGCRPLTMCTKWNEFWTCDAVIWTLGWIFCSVWGAGAFGVCSTDCDRKGYRVYRLGFPISIGIESFRFCSIKSGVCSCVWGPQQECLFCLRTSRNEGSSWCSSDPTLLCRRSCCPRIFSGLLFCGCQVWVWEDVPASKCSSFNIGFLLQS